MYGLPMQGITAVPTTDDPLHWLKWPSSALFATETPIPLPNHLAPPSPKTPPVGLYYPIAPIYKLNNAPDDRFRRRYRYATKYDPNQASHLSRLYANVISPPHMSIDPSVISGSHSALPQIPGMIQMTPGIPYAVEIGGDPKKLVTVGCVHTLQSLESYPDECKAVQGLADELQILTWGSKDPNGCQAIYKLPSFKRNDRSAKPSSSNLEPSFEGSYNLANTVVKGQGSGTFAPAVQSDTPQARSQLRRVLTILHQLYNILLPLSVSREEWEILSYVMAENNVFTFGGGGIGPTGCQLNVSCASLGEQLKDNIGIEQGSWHVDRGDDPLTHSLIVRLQRIPPGECIPSIV